MKKLTAFWLAFIVVLGSICSVTAIGVDFDRTLGDIDNNGKVEVTDATYVQRYIAKLLDLDIVSLLASDVDGDGKITVMDCTNVQQFVAKMIDRLPADVEPTSSTEISTNSSLQPGTTPSETPTQTEPVAPTETQQPTQTEDKGPSEYELEILRLVNIEREKEGLEPLEFGYFFYDCAKVRAKECAPMNDCKHTRPDGRPWHTVFTDFNINEDRDYGIGENIAWGHRSAQQVMYHEVGWMNSPGHRANIMNPKFKYVAIGSAECVEQPGTYATVQLFWG